MPDAPGNMIEFVDTSLRDGHQSLLATRMSGKQVMQALPLIRDAGYRGMELWGGAVLDASLRFTNEDPFERLDDLRRCLDEGPLGAGGVQIRSLCRGQNLFGYAPYPDNVVSEFMKEAVRSGSAPANKPRTDGDGTVTPNVNKSMGHGAHRIRIFDALNDVRNLVTALMATKAFNGVAEAALSYTTSPVHDVDHFVRFARAALDCGADALAIKDMAGLLHPSDAFTLIEALQRDFPGVELTLHSHCTTGLATATYVVGLLTGVDRLDTAHGPLAGGTSQPPVELLQWFADALDLNTNVDPSSFRGIDTKLRQLRAELADIDKNQDHIGQPWPAHPTKEQAKQIDRVIELLQQRDRHACDLAVALIEEKFMRAQNYPAADTAQLESQVPGGMISNLQSQLQDQGKLDLLPQILEEIPRVRKSAGYVPLVTPTSQIVGSQAAFNIILGEPYKQVSIPFRDVVMGKFGKLPGPVDSRVLEKVSGGEPPYVGRAADLVDDVDLPAVFKSHGDLIRTHRDLLLLLLFPMPARTFLANRNKTDA
jgi:pyruvate/oxaloacetate carboxyltransferase